MISLLQIGQMHDLAETHIINDLHLGHLTTQGTIENQEIGDKKERELLLAIVIELDL